MKYIIKIMNILITALLFCSCEEYLPHPYGNDGVDPGKVNIKEIVNIPGGAIIYFTPPDDVDLLYIKAVYTDDKNNEREVKVSHVIDSLIIEGYGNSGNYEALVYAVDRGENHSEPVRVAISPLDPPINLIFPTLQAVVDYGGIKVSYENEMRDEISINVAVYDSLLGRMTYRESFFTSQKSGSYSFRGYKSVLTQFGIYLEDRWGNLSDTLFVEVAPIPDEYLDKSRFSIFKMQGDQDFSQHGFNATQMWDNIWNSQWNGGHTASSPHPHYLTIDLGVTAKLSRFKLYQRAGTELYKHGNPKHFKVYGIKDLRELPPYDPENPNAGWTLLKECHSFKPSGLPVGQTTAEDLEFQIKGEDFEFDFESMIEVRYVRFEILEVWESPSFPYTVIGELSFWGEIISEEF